MHLYFWLQEPLSERYYKSFGIERLKKRGLDVSFWDFTPWLEPRLWEKITDDMYEIENYQLIHSWNEYVQLIDKTNITWVVDMIGTRDVSNAINLKAQEKGIRRIKCWQSLLTVHRFTPGIMDKFIFSIKTDPLPFLYRGFKELKRAFQRKGLDSVDADLHLCSGEYSERMIRNNTSALKVWAHSWDYDTYLESDDIKTKLINEEYIVFIDSSTPLHTDFLLTGSENTFTTIERYYPALNKFFNRIEESLQLPVVIAAHPVSSYDKIGNLYAGRRIVKNKTAQLVRNARLVITQSSTSDSFAVLWRKPLVLITTNEKLYDPSRWHLHATCKAFETDYINVDRYKGNLDLWKLAHRPLERYDFFRNGFIKRDGTPEKNSWDILVDFLEMNHLV